jgi:hypothetical protein
LYSGAGTPEYIFHFAPLRLQISLPILIFTEKCGIFTLTFDTGKSPSPPQRPPHFLSAKADFPNFFSLEPGKPPGSYYRIHSPKIELPKSNLSFRVPPGVPDSFSRFRQTREELGGNG